MKCLKNENKQEQQKVLALSGYIKNLLETDIMLPAGGQRSTFGSEGKLPWHDEAEATIATTEIGRLNDIFRLLEPAMKVSAEEIQVVVKRMSEQDYSAYAQQLREAVPKSKKRVTTYYLVSWLAAIVAYEKGQNLGNLLVPVGGESVEGGICYAGLVPAWMMFEEGGKLVRAEAPLS